MSFPKWWIVRRPGVASLVWILGLLGLGGCGSGVVPGSTGVPSGGGGSLVGPITDGNRDATLTSPKGKTSGEPNDSFAEAVVAVFEGSRAQLVGTVSQRGDIDVYLLGALSRGDAITVNLDTDALGSVLDSAVSIHDAGQRLVYNNDDRSAEDLDSLAEWIVRNDSSAYYLVVSHSAFSAGGRFAGAYQIDVTIESGLPVPAPRTQTLLLDFDGGLVDSPTLGQVSIAPFSAGRIGGVYSGQSELIKEAIRKSVEENFQGFAVDVVTTDDGPVPSGTVVSTIFLGGFDAATFGIAENVDLYNVDLCDDAIIYTESFSLGQFSFVPSAAELAVAIGNVTAHEAGHLMGLNHVDDDAALMDDRSAADALLLDQAFMEAPMSTDIIPIGTQDAAFLLTDIVGLR